MDLEDEFQINSNYRSYFEMLGARSIIVPSEMVNFLSKFWYLNLA